MLTGLVPTVVVSLDRCFSEALASGMRRRGREARGLHPSDVTEKVSGILLLDMTTDRPLSATDIHQLIGEQTSRVVLLGTDPRGLLEGVEVHAQVSVEGDLDALVAASEELGAKSVAEQARHGWASRRGRVVLTDRERDLLRELLAGRNSGQIAEQWIVSEHTVRSHIQNLLQKLAVRSQAEAVAWAVRAGLSPAAPSERAGA